MQGLINGVGVCGVGKCSHREDEPLARFIVGLPLVSGFMDNRLVATLVGGLSATLNFYWRLTRRLIG